MADQPRETVAEIILAAMEARGYSVRGLARALSRRDGGTAENWRRAVNRYLLEGATPEASKAAVLSAELEVPVDQITRPVVGRVGELRALREELAEIRMMVAELLDRARAA